MRRIIVFIKKCFKVLKNNYAFGVVFLIWWFISYFKIFPQYFFPSPFDVFALFFKTLFDGELLKLVLISLTNCFLGFALGFIVATLFVFLSVNSKHFKQFILPLVRATYPIPKIAWLPLFLLWFGFSFKSLVFLVALTSFFDIFYNFLAGIENVNVEYKRAGKSLGLSGYKYFKEILFWGSFPFILTGIRLAIGSSWRVTVAIEMLASTVHGLGWFLWRASEFFRYDQVFVSIITIALVGLCLEKFLIKVIEEKTINIWYK